MFSRHLLQVLSGLVAGVISLTALKANAVELEDDRAVRQKGFDLIYEARDLDLDQATRDGLSQYRKNIDSTKARVKEAERIVDTKLEPLIKKKYWWASDSINIYAQHLCTMCCKNMHHSSMHSSTVYNTESTQSACEGG